MPENCLPSLESTTLNRPNIRQQIIQQTTKIDQSQNQIYGVLQP